MTVTLRRVSGETLKRAARRAAKFRGHDMRPFLRGVYSKTLHSSDCRICGAAMIVNERPAPNDTEISGRAVALNCPAERKAP